MLNEIFVRGHIELHGIPNQFWREEIRLILHDARITLIETDHAVYTATENGEQYPITPPPTQSSFRTQRRGTPVLEVSECDTEYRRIELRAMQEANEREEEVDHTSTIVGDDRDEEISEANSD